MRSMVLPGGVVSDIGHVRALFAEMIASRRAANVCLKRGGKRNCGVTHSARVLAIEVYCATHYQLVLTPMTSPAHLVFTGAACSSSSWRTVTTHSRSFVKMPNLLFLALVDDKLALLLASILERVRSFAEWLVA